MEPPFPGMDPYLEAPSIWPDVHNSLITAIRDQIQVAIVPRYRAMITPYVAFENVEIASATVEVPTEYGQIEIRTVSDHRLVTVLELLSPANKRIGTKDSDAYHIKRQAILRGDAHLLEIDLLRWGRRPQTTYALPNTPYFIFLSRVQHRPQFEIWPLMLHQPITPIPIPLRYPDADIPLDLGLAIREAYRRARYDLEVDYRQAPPPPALSPDNATWLDVHLRERRVRS